jgi:hypothetical protein
MPQFIEIKKYEKGLFDQSAIPNYFSYIQEKATNASDIFANQATKSFVLIMLPRINIFFL